jgi:hypothetical protein
MDFAFPESGNLLPALAWHSLDSDGALQHRGEGAGEIVRRDACGPSNSTTWVPLQSSRRSAAARPPTSCVATIGNSLSTGCRKLRSTPSSRAEGTSQTAFSINQPGLRKVTDRPICFSDVPSTCAGSAGSRAAHRHRHGRDCALSLGKAGLRIGLGGGRMKTPAAPLKAEVRFAA